MEELTALKVFSIILGIFALVWTVIGFYFWQRFNKIGKDIRELIEKIK